MLKSGTQINDDSKKTGSRFRCPSLSPRPVVSSFFIRVHLGSLFDFIGGLTMKQRKNIVKQASSKDVLFRPVPST
jgi:hypothetical protein